MPLSTLSAVFSLPTAAPSVLQSNQAKLNLNVGGPRRVAMNIIGRDAAFVVRSVSSGDGSIQFGVPFPGDYEQLLYQATEATRVALKDGIQLMEIEFPTAGLESVPGDGEGGIEMTGSMQLIREFCDLLVVPEKATKTRIFFPEANEVQFARKSVFGGASFKLDYLTKPSFFQDFGIVEKVKMVDRVKEEDELFIVGYPYFNVNEMLVVEELYKEAVAATNRQMIIFNGELDRIRSGCRNGGALFRCYPGAWKVLKRLGGRYVCVHQQEKMPTLKEVALDILPSS